MANNYLFITDKTWDGTNLYNHGEEVPAAQLFLHYRVERNVFDRIDGGGAEAFVVPMYVNGDGDQVILPRQGIFPGILDIQISGVSGQGVGTDIRVECNSPFFTFEDTRVFYEGVEVTETIVELFLDINYPDNVVQGFISFFKSSRFRPDEITQVAFL